MSSPRTTYARLADTSFEAELGALADIYTLAKKAARPGCPDDGEESKNASTAEPKYKR